MKRKTKGETNSLCHGVGKDVLDRAFPVRIPRVNLHLEFTVKKSNTGINDETAHLHRVSWASISTARFIGMAKVFQDGREQRILDIVSSMS